MAEHRTWSWRLRQALVEQLPTRLSRDARDARVRERTAQLLLSLQESDKPFACSQLTRQNRTCLNFTHPADKIVDSVSSAHIRQQLSLTSANRNSIIKTLVSLLPELCRATLHRLDIQNCFESIDREMAIQQLLSTDQLDVISRTFLQRYDETCKAQQSFGLSRGIAASSVICEWLLQRLDAQLRQHPGVFFYSRFVDDILIIQSESKSTPDPQQSCQDLLEGLPGKPKLNSSKCETVKIMASKNDTAVLEKPFHYLGYVFSNSRHPHQLSVDIAPAKVKKIKSRIVSAMLRFTSNQKFGELLNAIRYLSSNTALVKRGVANRAMHTGIYFNYPALTADTYPRGNLSQLDGFVRSIVFGSRTALSRKVRSMLSSNQKHKLLRLSFVAGHRDRVMAKFTRQTARRLVEGWKRRD